VLRTACGEAVPALRPAGILPAFETRAIRQACRIATI